MALDFEFQSRFEEEESAIRDRMLQHEQLVPYRKEPGDFVFDIIAAMPLEIQQEQANQDDTLRNAFTLFADGTNLEYKVAEANITKTDAQPAGGVLQITANAGVQVVAGRELSTNYLDDDGNPVLAEVQEEVIFDATSTKPIKIKTLSAGDRMNVPAGSSWIFSQPLAGVSLIEQPEDLAGGLDRESDTSVRNKWKEKVQKPVRSGNRQHYVAWAQEVPGVGNVRVIPRWAGRGTVKVIIADLAGRPATEELVATVQNYLDPVQDEDGEGVAPIGATITVESVANKNIATAASLVLAEGSTLQDAAETFNADLDEYLRTISEDAFASRAPQMTVYFNKIAGLLSLNEHVLDYTGLTVNEGTANIVIESHEIPIRENTVFT